MVVFDRYRFSPVGSDDSMTYPPGVFTTDLRGAAMTCDVSCLSPSTMLEPASAATAATAPPAINLHALTADVLVASAQPEAAFLPPSVSTTSLVQAVAQWDGVRLSPNARRAVVFMLDDGEVGSVRPNGSVSIPFPEPIRDTLMQTGTDASRRFDGTQLSITIEMRTPADVRCAAFLLHLSHFYRTIIASRSIQGLAALRAELVQMDLPAPLRAHYLHAMEHKAAAFI